MNPWRHPLRRTWSHPPPPTICKAAFHTDSSPMMNDPSIFFFFFFCGRTPVARAVPPSESVSRGVVLRHATRLPYEEFCMAGTTLSARGSGASRSRMYIINPRTLRLVSFCLPNVTLSSAEVLTLSIDRSSGYFLPA